MGGYLGAKSVYELASLKLTGNSKWFSANVVDDVVPPGAINDLVSPGNVDDLANSGKTEYSRLFNLENADDMAKNGTATSRPTWRQSEADVGNLNPDYEAQKSFLNGKEVPYATSGSSRPDFYKTGSSIEVKNYNVTNSSGRNSLINTVSNQVDKRNINLPSGTKQIIIIDIRGQQVSNDVLRRIRTSILEKSDTDVIIQFMR